MPSSELDSILAELSAREPIFHRREYGSSREALLEMTAEDFWEIGASGQKQKTQNHSTRRTEQMRHGNS